jgi:hypothetical protein
VERYDGCCGKEGCKEDGEEEGEEEAVVASRLQLRVPPRRSVWGRMKRRSGIRAAALSFFMR